MKVKNPTKYFNDYTKFYNVVLDKGSFGYESSSRLAYYQRLYYELQYTRKVNGIAFFYTLTYCDAKIPKFLGRNVHSYKDVRLVTNGFLSKVLLRKYGSRLRYFCACESGEGGTQEHHIRGLGNNPHYHFIFFVQPVHDENNEPNYNGYRRITVPEFTRLLRGFWLGKESGYMDYRRANFGIVEEGSLGAEIQSPDAFSYVVKYVIKDAVSKQTDNIVYKHYFNECQNMCGSWHSLYEYYVHLKFVKPFYNRERFFKEFDLSNYRFQRFRKITSLPFSEWCMKVANDWVKGNFFHYKEWFTLSYCDEYARYKVREFNNNYGPKVRLSNGLGEYGLQFIKDVDSNPRVVFNYCGQMTSQYPCLYYIRKLYYNVRKCPYTGNPLYYLNERGIDLRISQCIAKIQATYNSTYDSITFALANRVHVPYKFDSYLYQKLLDKIVNNEVLVFDKEPYYGLTYLSELFHRSDFDYILRAYSIYVNVYQYRHYRIKSSYNFLNAELDLHDVITDYHFFLTDSPNFLDYNEHGIYCLYAKGNSDLLEFKDYYVFAPYIQFFDFMDSLIQCVSMIHSGNKKRQFSENSEHAKRIQAYNHS